MKKYALVLVVLLSGCAVNRAVIDPYAYAPENGCSYWTPDDCALALRGLGSVSCEELPAEEHELSLAEVLDIALVSSPVTQVSWAQARAEAGRYGESQSAFFPNISAEFFHSRTRTAFLASQVEQQQNIQMEGVIVSDQTTWGPQLHATWTLLDFGQRRYTSEAARYMLYFADFSHNQTVQMLVETVTLDYYSYLYEVKQLEANEADLATAVETLEAANVGIESGARDVSDVLQARTQALLAEIELSQQRKAVKEAYTKLLESMGLPANASIKTQSLPMVELDAFQLDPLDTYLCTALQCRPDLMAARAQLESNEMSLKAAKRQWTPVLDYSLDVGRTYFSGGFHDDYDLTSTFSLSMPLFTGFHIRNSVKTARAKVDEACAKLKESELQVIQEVTASHYNVGVAFETLNAANRFLIAAKEQYEVAISQYREGVNTILDVVSAQSSLFDARAQQAQAIQQWFSTLATLVYASGILSNNIGTQTCENN